MTVPLRALLLSVPGIRDRSAVMLHSQPRVGDVILNALFGPQKNPPPPPFGPQIVEPTSVVFDMDGLDQHTTAKLQ